MNVIFCGIVCRRSVRSNGEVVKLWPNCCGSKRLAIVVFAVLAHWAMPENLAIVQKNPKGMHRLGI